MTERIVDLVRIVAQQASSKEAKELLALIGTDGHLHEENQRHPSRQTGKQAKPTHTTHQVDELPDLSKRKLLHDVTFVPERGFYLSSAVLRSWLHDHDRLFPDDQQIKYQHEPTFIAEDRILEWADEIKTVRGYDAVLKEWQQTLDEHAKEYHPGTDTVDRGKDGRNGGTDQYEHDVSRSTLSMGVTNSTGTYLNGSPVQHRSFIHLEVHGPDGIKLVDVAMSMEQFATALVGSRHVPCTLQSYWSSGPDTVRLVERVRPPPTVEDKLQRRIADRIAEKHAWMRKVQVAMQKAAEDGKLGKTAIKEMARDLKIAMEHIEGTADYAIEQSLQEVAKIVETASMHIQQQHGISKEQLQANMELSSILCQKQLPAPK